MANTVAIREQIQRGIDTGYWIIIRCNHQGDTARLFMTQFVKMGVTRFTMDLSDRDTIKFRVLEMNMDRAAREYR